MTEIIVDHREKSSGIVKELVKWDIQVKTQQLITADFVVQTKDAQGTIHTVGIERKTQNDFINSIIDKRIIKQLIMLKDNFSIPLLIIEGSENIYALRNFHPNAIRGMLASIAIDYQIPIIHTKNYRDTASLLKTIVKRFEKPKKHISLLSKRTPPTLKEQQEFLIETLPSVGAGLAKALLKKFKSVHGVLNASEKDLLEVDKIGKTKAKTIRNVIESKYKS